jgi:iron(III) transport system substrate-binding protein
MSDRRQFVKGLTATGALSLAGVAPTMAGSVRDDVIKAAEKEGGFIWYDHYGRDQGEAVLKAFQADFPFIKRAEFVDIPASQRDARLIQESLAGGPTSDVIFTGAPAMQKFVDQKFTMEVDWKGLGIEPSPATTPSSHMVSLVTPINMPIYNSNRVTGGDVPRTWEDMVDPKWKGRVGVWSRPLVYVQLSPVWGEAKARDYVKRLAALNPRLMPGTFPLAQAVAAGEVDIGVGSYDATIRIQEKGAPVKMVPLDPTVVSNVYGGVMKYGKHPNAAKLFLAWLNTGKGALTFEKMTKRGNYRVPETDSAKFLKGKPVTFVSAQDEIAHAAKFNDLEKEFSRILQRG